MSDELPERPTTRGTTDEELAALQAGLHTQFEAKAARQQHKRAGTWQIVTGIILVLVSVRFVFMRDFGEFVFRPHRFEAMQIFTAAAGVLLIVAGIARSQRWI